MEAYNHLQAEIGADSQVRSVQQGRKDSESEWKNRLEIIPERFCQKNLLITCRWPQEYRMIIDGLRLILSTMGSQFIYGLLNDHTAVS